MDNKTQELLANKFSKRFEEYNTRVLKELAGTIKQFKELTPSQARKLAQELKYSKNYIDLLNELSKLTGQSKKELKQLLDEVARQDIEFADVYFKARNMETPIYENSKTYQNIVKSVADTTGEDFVNLAKSTGFTFLDNKGHIKFLDMKETYYKLIDECVYAVNTGIESYDSVINKTINQLADSGVKRIVYANDGKRQYTQRIDTAVRRNVMDSMRETTIKINEELGKRFRYDGWEITVHSEPAPDHMYVQGHQFRKEEFDKFNNDEDCVDVNGIEYPATSKETGRDRRSIGQYNCYHTAFPIIVGVSKPLFSDEELKEIIENNNKKIEIDGKEYTKYEVTQLQRKIETEIRKSKDKHIMYKTTDDRLGILKEQKRITELTNKYKEISKKANLTEQLDRTRVSGYRRSKISK